jgi:hypothetical protein
MVAAADNPLAKRKNRQPSGRFKPSLVSGLSGAITGKVTRLTNEAIEEISRPRDKYRISEYRKMLESSPEAAACVEMKALRARASIGEYSHENKEIQKFIQDNLDHMQGSLGNVVHQMSSALPYGFSVAEIAFTNRSPGRRFEWRLDTINPLDPDRIHFAGRKGNITHTIFSDAKKGRQWIDYSRCLHVVNGINFGEPFGSPEARRAMPIFKAMQLILSEMVVAGKNNATGILLAQADSNERVRVLGPDGKPIMQGGKEKTMTGPEALLHQMKGLESSGIIATDIKNKVMPLLIPSDSGYWLNTTQILKKALFLSFMVPSLIWDEGSGGLGNAGISGNHLAVLDSNIDAIVRQIEDQLVEKLVRPLIQWNFGWQKNWGKFEKQPYTSPEAQMGRIGNLISAISTQIIPATDLDAINRLREDLGIAPITLQDMMAMQQMTAAMQQMAAAPGGESPEEGPPEG